MMTDDSNIPTIDVSELSEDSRIQAIGMAVNAGKRVSVAFDRNDPEKIERYIRKVMERYPGAGAVQVIDGPDELVGVQFGKNLQ